MPVVGPAFLIHQVGPCQIAFPAPGGHDPAHASHRNKLAQNPLAPEFTDQVVQADTVAADDRQFRKLEL